jgi:NADPH:quinone reductase-like Zn-dependent oxidoreductase
MLAAQLTAYGDPEQNVRVVEVPEPPAPQADEVLLGMEFSPINPGDLLLAMGWYAFKPELPTVMGHEGVATVLSVGKSVKNVSRGDRVAPPLGGQTWRERLVVPAAGLRPLPSKVPLEQLAMVRVNPVAAQMLLSEFTQLRSGDWIVQNAANSGVGRSVIAVAKQRGLNTINIVRRESLVAELVQAGATTVLVEGPDVVQRATSAAGGAPITLALDAVGGPASGTLASILSPRGTVVSYGAITGAPMSIGPGDLIYKSLTVRSFFVSDPRNNEKALLAMDQAANMMAAGTLSLPVAGIYKLSEVKTAIARAKQGGKVLLALDVRRS